jgi:hypothetical protein
VLRYVDLEDANYGHAALFAPRPGDVPLAEALGGALAVAREAPRREVVLGFDPRQSDLPLRPAFPLLVQNAIAWLAGDEAGFVAPLRAGEPSPLACAGAGVELVEADGRSLPVPCREGVALVTARAPGFATVRAAGQPDRLLAVNAPSVPPDVARVEAPSLAGRPLAAPPGKGPSPSPSLPEPWRPLVLAALALLAIEWWTFRRRITV